MAAYSKPAQNFISNKFSLMKNENRPQAQKVAIALNEARKNGYEIPPAPKTRFGKIKKLYKIGE